MGVRGSSVVRSVSVLTKSQLSPAGEAMAQREGVVLLPHGARLLCTEVWIHVALIEFQLKTPQQLHPDLQRWFC